MVASDISTQQSLPTSQQVLSRCLFASDENDNETDSCAALGGAADLFCRQADAFNVSYHNKSTHFVQKRQASTSAAARANKAPLATQLAANWDHAKNRLKRPSEMSSDSTNLVWWKCPTCTASFQARVKDYVKEKGRCPSCTHIPRKSTSAVARASSKKHSLEMATKNDVVLPYTRDPRTLSPILAYPWEKYHHQFTEDQELYVTPKLDGIRCIAACDQKTGAPFILSRIGNPLTSTPQVNKALMELFEKDKKLVLDGELYHHDLKDKFELLVGAVRTRNGNFKDAETAAAAHKMQFHVFDTMYSGSFAEDDTPYTIRSGLYADLLSKVNAESKSVLIPVQQHVIQKKDVQSQTTKFCAEGYEGSMARSGADPYVHTRSSGLLKVKRMEDDEFVLIKIEEGKGRLAKTAGNAVLQTKDGKTTFNASLSCDDTQKRDLWRNRSRLANGHLVATVQYQGLTKNGVPRFPILKTIRGDVDGKNWL